MTSPGFGTRIGDRPRFVRSITSPAPRSRLTFFAPSTFGVLSWDPPIEPAVGSGLTFSCQNVRLWSYTLNVEGLHLPDALRWVPRSTRPPVVAVCFRLRALWALVVQQAERYLRPQGALDSAVIDMTLSREREQMAPYLVACTGTERRRTVCSRDRYTLC